MRWVARLRQAPVTVALLAINVGVYLAMVVASHHAVSFERETLIAAGASVRTLSIAFSPWRWLAAAYVHGGLLHIVMNMWVLAQIGALGEVAIGRGLFAAIYVAAGVAGNVLATLMGPRLPAEAAALDGVNPLAYAPISVGASGAIMGLIGVSAVFAWQTGQRAIARSLLTNVAFIFVVGMFANVDNYAHLGGLLLGGAVGLWRARWKQPLAPRLERALIGAAAALSASALLIVHLLGGQR
ncbi:MAG TPA: rhomboid family intramembrane serine protease [Polyangia bacterium]|nr:rhomboid family intramembrane serine protease [Polyangia bacterium]